MRKKGDREREREILLMMAILFPAEDHRPSVYEIADDKASLQRASGWKIIHFTSQLQEMVRKKITVSFLAFTLFYAYIFLCVQTEVEEDILKTMQRLQDSVNNLDQTGTCQVDPERTTSFKELVQVRRKNY